MQKGIVSSLNDWSTHPLYSNGSVAEWFAGLILILIVSFLWTQVINAID